MTWDCSPRSTTSHAAAPLSTRRTCSPEAVPAAAAPPADRGAGHDADPASRLGTPGDWLAADAPLVAGLARPRLPARPRTGAGNHEGAGTPPTRSGQHRAARAPEHDVGRRRRR